MNKKFCNEQIEMPGGWIRCELHEDHEGKHSWSRGYITWDDVIESSQDSVLDNNDISI